MQTALKIWNDAIHSKQDQEFAESIEIIQNHKDLTVLPEVVADSIQFVWKNSKVLKESMDAMPFKHKILEETTVYFWNELERIKQANYTPTDLDFLHLTHRTTGFVVCSF